MLGRDVSPRAARANLTMSTWRIPYIVNSLLPKLHLVPLKQQLFFYLSLLLPFSCSPFPFKKQRAKNKFKGVE